MSYSELLLGCGNARDKRIKFTLVPDDWQNLTTHDVDPESKADVIHDLDVFPYPWSDNQFDEVHAYEVLEHCGQQGDAVSFFAQFAELWRILKPGGYLCGTVPQWNSPMAWGVPDHKRVMPKELFTVLDARYYEDLGKESGKGKADYRKFLKTTNFAGLAFQEGEYQMGFVLQAIK